MVICYNLPAQAGSPRGTGLLQRFLNISSKRHFTTSLGNLFQCSLTHTRITINTSCHKNQSLLSKYKRCMSCGKLSFPYIQKAFSMKGKYLFLHKKICIRAQDRVSFLILFEYDLLKPVFCEFWKSVLHLFHRIIE